jgi:hypothetical protein
LIQWKAEGLQRDVREWWTRPGKEPKFDFATLAPISEKLDLIAGHVSKLSPVAFDVPVTPCNTSHAVTTEINERNRL